MRTEVVIVVVVRIILSETVPRLVGVVDTPLVGADVIWEIGNLGGHPGTRVFIAPCTGTRKGDFVTQIRVWC